MKNKMEFMTFKMGAQSASLIEEREWQGESFLVVPVIMMVEGVHSGSGGPTLWTAEELKKFPAAWNGRPIPVFHPTNQSGDPISANSPEVLDAHNVGHVWSVKFEGNSLKGEAWINKSIAEERFPEVLEHLYAGSLEVSTGAFVDGEEIEGVWNNNAYQSVARNIRPDHLAVLPGGRGACSWESGCGLPRINKAENAGDPKTAATIIYSAIKEALSSIGGGIENLSTNEAMTHDQIRNLLQIEVDKLDVPSSNGTEGVWHYVVDVFDSEVVYRKDGPGAENKLLKQAYFVDEVNGTAALMGEPVEVRKVISFEEISTNSPIEGKEEKQTMKNNEKGGEGCCPERIAKIIAHEGSPWSEEDKPLLEAMEEAVLEKMEAMMESSEASKGEGTPGEGDKVVVDTEAAAEGEEGKMVSMEEYLKLTPEPLRSMIASALAVQDARKEFLVLAIKESDHNAFEVEDLKAMEMSTLEKVYKISLAGKEEAPEVMTQPSYLGKGPGGNGERVSGISVQGSGGTGTIPAMGTLVASAEKDEDK